MDSILVVCYSFTGNSRRLAQLIASHHGWPLAEIRDAAPRGNFGCLLDSLLRRQPAIRYDGPDPADFRTVVLVSPIWAWRLAGPMRSFIAAHANALQRVAVVSTMGGSGASNALLEIDGLLGRPPLLADAFTAQEIQDGSCTARAIAFGDALVPGSTRTQAAQPGAWAPHGSSTAPQGTP